MRRQHELRPRIRPLPLLAGLLIAAQAGTAWAGYIDEEFGDWGGDPFYRAFTFVGLDPDNDNGISTDLFEGISYGSNVAPRPIAFTNTTENFEGATMNGTAWSVSSGFYAARSYAHLNVTNGQANHRYYAVAGQGSTTNIRIFDESARADRAVFTWHVSGTESNGLNVGQATGRLDFAASTDPNLSWLDLFSDTGIDGQITEFGTGTFTYTLPLSDLGQPIYLYYWSSAFVEYLWGDVPTGANFSGTANYANTVVLEDVQLLDANDVPIDNWQMVDQNSLELVFNQDGRMAPVLAAPIPEPSTWGLMAAGALFLGWRMRRRSDQGQGMRAPAAKTH